MVSCASDKVVGLALGVSAKSKARDFCVVPAFWGGVVCRRVMKTVTGTAMPTINATAAMGTTMTGRWYQTMLLYQYVYTVHKEKEEWRYRSGMAMVKCSVLLDHPSLQLAIIVSGSSPVSVLRKI
jgi:hypothetical protein